jgi:hypothetical protein
MKPTLTAAPVLALALAVLASSAYAEELRLVTDRTVKGRLTAVTADGRLEFRPETGEPAAYGGDDVYSVEVHPESAAPPVGGRRVWLADGLSRLPAASFALSGGRVTVEGKILGKLEFGLDALAAVRLAEPKDVKLAANADADGRLAKLLSERPARDTVMVAGKDGKLLEVEGVLKAVSDREVTLTFEGTDRTVNTARVFAVVMAAAKPAPPAGRGPETVAELSDGGLLAGRLARVSDEAFAVSPAGLPEVSVPRKATARLQFSSARIVEVSSLAPARAVERPFFQVIAPAGPGAPANAGGAAESGLYDFAFQKNRRNDKRGKLRLGGVEYPTGLGVHSYSELHFALGGEFERFTAQIGIDDAAQGAGSVDFVVKLDDREVFRKSMTGRDAPAAVSLDVAGAQRITLVVEDKPDNLGISDLADWAGARLLRKKR